MQCFIASDHRGYNAKQFIVNHYSSSSDVNLVDLGPTAYVAEDDYNDGAISVSSHVLSHPESIGILICGSSLGVTMQANRFKGIRAASCPDATFAKLARQHNDANVLCIPADFLDTSSIIDIIDTFISTAFLNEPRLIRRNRKLDEDYKS